MSIELIGRLIVFDDTQANVEANDGGLGEIRFARRTEDNVLGFSLDDGDTWLWTTGSGGGVTLPDPTDPTVFYNGAGEWAVPDSSGSGNGVVSDPPVNIALVSLGASATASSGSDPAHPIDDTDWPNIGWESAEQMVGEWIKIDLGSSKNIAEFTIDQDPWSDNYALEFDVEYSNDDSTWSLAAHIVYSYAYWSTYSRLPTAHSGRYWRFTATVAPSTPVQTWIISKLELLEKSSSGIDMSAYIRNPMTYIGDLIFGGGGGAPNALAKGTDGKVLTMDTGVPAWRTPTSGSGSGSGDVVGPSSAVDGHLAVFDSTTGKLIKDGGVAPVQTKVAFVKRTTNAAGGSAYAVSNGSWAAIDATNLSLTVAAVAGDILGIGVNGEWGGENHYGELTAATIVSSSPVNYIDTGTGTPGTSGVMGWTDIGDSVAPGAGQNITGEWLYTIQAGDISGGNVTVRLYGYAYGTKNIMCMAGYPLQFYVKNYGH